MRSLKLFAVIGAVATVALIAAGAQTASATVLCKTTSTPCSETLSVGSELALKNIGSTKLTFSFKTVECSSSGMAGKMTAEGGSSATALVTLESFSVSGCNCEFKVLRQGTLEIHHIAETDNGTVISNETEITTLCATIFGNVHCIFVTENDDIGTLVGGNPAKLKVSSVLTRRSTNSICNELIGWDAEYEVTSPNPLYVEPGGSPPTTGTVLCTETTTPCPEGKDQSAGAEISSSLVTGSKSKLIASYKHIECGKSSMKSAVTNTGGSSSSAETNITTLFYEECNCTVTVLKDGTLQIEHISSTDDGTVKSTGTEVTVSCSTIFGNVHCIYATENTDLGTLEGGKPAKLKVNVELPSLSTNGLCNEESRWEAEYEVTKPNPLYIEPG